MAVYGGPAWKNRAMIALIASTALVAVLWGLRFAALLGGSSLQVVKLRLRTPLIRWTPPVASLQPGLLAGPI